MMSSFLNIVIRGIFKIERHFLDLEIIFLLVVTSLSSKI
jgi:hypothetical protein